MGHERKDTAIYVAYDDAEPLDLAFAEKRLLQAILQAAMYDLCRPGEAGRAALEYFLDPDDNYVFSFRSVCSYLEIDPIHVLRYAGIQEVQGKGDF